MKTLKKLISFILVAALCVGVMSSMVYALNGPYSFTVVVENEPSYYKYTTNSADSLTECGVNISSLRNYLRNSIKNHVTSIDVSKYNISYAVASSNDENLVELSGLVSYEIPENLDMEKGFQFSINTSKKIVTAINVVYELSQEEYNTKLAACDAAAEEIISDIVDADITDAEKVMLVHDRLCVMGEYDPSYYSGMDTDLLTMEDFRMSGILLNKYGVCQSYALAFVYIMEKLGIESRLLASTNHAWNMVTIDGETYNVDATYDDMTYDTYGMVSHTYLLKSTDYYVNNTKNSHDLPNNIDTYPSDTTYDDYYWNNSKSGIQYLDGKFWYIDNATGNVKYYDPETETHTAVCSTSWSIYSPETDYEPAYYSFSRIAKDGSNIYYSNQSEIRRYDTITKTNTAVFTADSTTTEAANPMIAGFKIVDRVMYIDINAGSPYSGSGSRATYGKTIPLDVQITYDANGGENAPENQETELGAVAALSEDEPAREGYTFLGWARSSTAAKSDLYPGESIIISGNLTLYAVWSAEDYTLSFDANGGETDATDTEVTFGEKYGQLPEAERENYNFTGWFTQAEGGTEVTADTTVSTAFDHTLYAHWKYITYDVSYDANGGENAPDTQEKNKGEALILTTDVPTRTGYDFIGWATADDLTSVAYSSGDTYSADEAVTLYAVWSAKKYTVTFDTNGGTSEDIPSDGITVTYDSTYPTLPTATKDGCDFAGWYTSATGGDKIEADGKVTITSSTVLYAHWIYKSYTLYLDCAGGTATATSVPVTYTAVVSGLPTPVKSGYVFDGWKDADGADITSDYCYNFTSDSTATAQWIVKPEVEIIGKDSKTVDYGTTVTFECSSTSLPQGAEIVWYVDGKEYSRERTISLTAENSSYKVQCKVVRNGNVLSVSSVKTLKVNSNFFLRIIVFFKNLFGIYDTAKYSD